MVMLSYFNNTTKSAIDQLKYGEVRSYLGMSGIGHHCLRYLFLKFHWFYPVKHDGRRERIFNAGHLFEPMIIKQLKDAGMDVYKIIDGKIVEHYGHPDEEQEEYIGFAGHAKGHSDGRIIGVIEAPDTEHTFEAKTMKNSVFTRTCKDGVKKEHPGYYSQCQRYMKANGTKWTLFISINKDNSYLYIERIPLVDKDANELLRKEQNIILCYEVPENDYSKTYYKCEYCDQRPVCHKLVLPNKNCRTCMYADLENDGIWSCEIQKGKHLSFQEQKDGCEKYKLGWGFE